MVEKEQYAELASVDTSLGRLVNDPLALALVIYPTLVRTRPVHIGPITACSGTAERSEAFGP